MKTMAKAPPASVAKVVRKSGRLAAVRGAGALKGRLTIEEGVDLTQPIASQILRESGSRDGALRTKR